MVINLAEHARYADLPHERAKEVAKAIHKIDPDIWITRVGDREPDYVPPRIWKVMHAPFGREAYVIKYVSPDQIDERLLADFLEGSYSTNGLLDTWKAHELAVSILKKQRETEYSLEKIDETKTLLDVMERNHYAKHNGKYIDRRNG